MHALPTWGEVVQENRVARQWPPLGEELVSGIEAAWERPREDSARERLRLVRLIAHHELTAEQIAKGTGVGRMSVFNYREKAERGSLAGLLVRDRAEARNSASQVALDERFIAA